MPRRQAKNRSSLSFYGLFTIITAMFRMLFFAVLLFASVPAQADNVRNTTEKVPEAFHVTNFPLPRFASLQQKEVYVRSGPGLKYPIKWVYKKPGLPVEIILEFEVWRKIRDIEGQEGWVHTSLLAGKRTGIIQKMKDAAEDSDKKDETAAVPLYQKPRVNARLSAKLMPGAIVTLDECIAGWCSITAEGYEGWIDRKFIWGVYEGESIE